MKPKRRIMHLLAGLLCIVILADGCGHKKAFNRAKEYEKSGLYLEAVNQDLEALAKKQKYEKARAHLRQIAPLAYQELLREAEWKESASQWLEAVSDYRSLEALLAKLRRHAISFETVNVAERIAQAESRGAAYYYARAEEHFRGEAYEAAIVQYKNVRKIAKDYRDAKDKLRQSYLKLGERELAARRFQAAVDFFEQARAYVEEGAAIRERIAEAYYQWAESLEARREFKEAMAKFEQADDANYGHYKNAKTRAGLARRSLWLDYVQRGDGELAALRFQNAIDLYRNAQPYADEPAANNEKIAEAYYQWGEKLFAGKNFREALGKFEQTHALVPNYKGADKRARESYEKAVRHVAILPFRNRANYGSQYAYLLADELINKCIQAQLEFAAFINRENLDQIFNEYKLIQSGVVDESKAVEVGKVKGIHSFVTGAVTQITVATSEPAWVEQVHEKMYTETDSSGKKIEKRRPVYYREYHCQRTVQVTAGFQIVDVETGRYLNGESFPEQLIDKAVWLRYQGSIHDLPAEKHKLLDASSEPRATELMIHDLVRSIAEKMSKKIVEYYR